ncbi:MAG: D-glycero-beta-D-manno-heptose 1-phosphate adenylyltransferase [Candidatus Binatia bacterium]
MHEKIRRIDEVKSIVAKAKKEGQKVVFTNGCFDVLHPGHLHLLQEARKLGDLLIVALNSDRSVKRIKGPDRPVLREKDRTELIAALEMVDLVTLFEEPDPLATIRELRPNVLVKGGDWDKSKIVGADLVKKDGGSVVVIPYLEGYSSTQIIERMCKR